MKYKIDDLLLIYGIGYTIIDIANSREVDTGTLLIGGAVTGAGLLARWLIRDTIRIKGRRKLVIIR